MAESPPTKEKALVRAIGRWSLAALVVNCVIGSGVFGLPSLYAGLVGPASVLAVLLAGAGTGVVTACFAEVSSQFTGTGGPYLYVRTAFGRFSGILVAWLYWSVRLTACAANMNLFVIYLGEFWPRATSPVPRLLILTLLMAMLAAINIRGVQVGKHVSDIFTIAKLAPLGLVCAAGGYFLIAAHRIVPLTESSAGAKSWVQVLALLMFAYGGADTALISTGEARDPRRDAPFALFAGLAACAVIYSLIQAVVVGVLPDPGHSERPLADVARIVLGNGGAVLVAVGALVSVYGYLSGNILATPRMTFALAEGGDFPTLFGAVHPRFRTPHLSIAIFALLVWLLALMGSFAGNATVSAGSRAAVYGLVCASVPILRRKQPGAARFRLQAGTFFAALGVLLCLTLLVRLFLVDPGKSLILAAAVAVALANWLAVRRKAGIASGVVLDAELRADD